VQYRTARFILFSVPNSPEPKTNNERLALILRLWRDLEAMPRVARGSNEYNVLMARIRREADAFRAALDHDDPTKS
jgi:hypothetical protein